MKINVTSNIGDVQKAMERAASQVPYALSVAMNKTADKARESMRAEMRRVFDRPTPFVLNSLRVGYAKKTSLNANLQYKDSWSSSAGETGGRTMIGPHIDGGARRFKGMEVRLRRAGMLPTGWFAMPGGGAKMDAYGNMSRGQITQLLNVLGTYTESGYNKADERTRARLAKGNVKKNIYGFVYWVNYVDGRGVGHIPPGVYQRVETPFGSSLKPILIFVKQARYKRRLPFFENVSGVVAKEFPGEFNRAFDEALRTALLKSQGQLL